MIKYTLTKNLRHNYVYFIVKFIQDIGDMLTVMTCIEWSFDVRWAHV